MAKYFEGGKGEVDPANADVHVDGGDTLPRLYSTISQIGVVVRDMDEYLRHIHRLFGASPSVVVRIPNETMKNLDRHYYGADEDFSASLAFFEFTSLQIEVIQPLSGRSVWKDFLDKRGEGIHHIRFSIDDMLGSDRHFKALGIEKAQDGYSTKNIEGLKWAYYDTEDQLGFFTEVINEFERNCNRKRTGEGSE